ncbi:hypothetical protein WJX74_004054 [Apatococcus lobatus]|uniref:Uncharacterized protein n=1 Tax=Apatococcus lobatus TaxID=904363 RepID=A0AAW1QVJ2_9CHLO
MRSLHPVAQKGEPRLKRLLDLGQRWTDRAGASHDRADLHSLLRKPAYGQSQDCVFSSRDSLLAVGLVSGGLRVYDCKQQQQPVKVAALKAHSGSCRAVCFDNIGTTVHTASAHGSLLSVDVATKRRKVQQKAAHPVGVCRLCTAAPNLIASGDDGGNVRIWDDRQNGACMSQNIHSEFVSDMAMHPREQCLMSVSGDGTLAVYDLRKNKLRGQSEPDEDEMGSVAVMRQGAKVVAGSQDGVLSIFSWGYFNDCSDRFPGHPASVDALISYDEDIVITGASDGIIRILNILPNKLVGIVGDHDEYPVERLALSSDKLTLASASHDDTVKLWDLAALQDDSSNDADAPAEDASDADSSEDAEALAAPAQKMHRAEKGAHKIPSRPKSQAADFFADLL